MRHGGLLGARYSQQRVPLVREAVTLQAALGLVGKCSGDHALLQQRDDRAFAVREGIAQTQFGEQFLLTAKLRPAVPHWQHDLLIDLCTDLLNDLCTDMH